MLVGIVEDLIFKAFEEMIVNSNRWKVHNTLASNPGKEVGLYIEPFDIQIMKISVYIRICRFGKIRYYK